MKLHDLHPAPGSKKARTRVGRGIAAGKGKTAGRGTKGQKARSGGALPPWFEGGQTPLQMRVPKLRGFKNRFRIEYEVVNVGRIAEAAAGGRFAAPEAAPAEASAKGRRGKSAPLTVNADLLREAGLIGTLRRPLKVLGAGEVDRPLFVVAEAFSGSARAKIEAAGGTAQVLQLPPAELAALGLGPEPPAEPAEPVKPTEQAEPTEPAEPAPGPAAPAGPSRSRKRPAAEVGE